MAEGRMLKKEIANSKKLGDCRSDRPRVLYFMMLPHLDIKGRLLADPQIIKGQITTILPYTTKSIQESLEELNRVGLIILYQVDDDQFLEYTRFGDFQTLNPDREAKSRIIAPTQEGARVLKSSLYKDKTSKAKKRKDYSPEFELFWKKFKGRWIPDDNRHEKGSKWEASEEWEKLSVEDQRKAWTVADRPRGETVPDGCRWLKKRRFDDFAG